MRSFVTIFLASILACLAFALLASEAKAQGAPDYYALKITLQENGQTFDAPQIVVEPGKNYTVELNANADYAFKIGVPADTRAAVIEQFERDLGRWASDFLLVNTELSFKQRPEAKDLPDYGKVITSNLLLRVAAPQREIRSDVPVSDRGLIGRDGQRIETLSITIKATPFG